MSSSKNISTEELQKFLDGQQYTRKGILLYEQIFGRTYVSTGGVQTTSKFCREHLKDSLREGARLLDVGCGIGGSAFYMARQFGVSVFGVDLSENMVGIAKDYRREMEPGVQHRVQFHVDDATTMSYPDNFYDVVYSRDTILHIADKPGLFSKFYRTMKPGGTLLITDYCRGDKKEHSEEFKAYVKQRSYNLLTVKEYGKTLEDAGFSDVQAIDSTGLFVEILHRELSDFKSLESRVVSEHSRQDFDHICQGWMDKVKRCEKDGDQAWGLFVARKLYQ